MNSDFDDLCLAIDAEENERVFLRGVDGALCPVGRQSRLPTPSELNAVPLEERALAIWFSGVAPRDPEMIAVFESVADQLGMGWIIGASIPFGLPPNPIFHRGEGRLDDLVWPDGYPAHLKKKPRPKSPAHVRRRTRREVEAHQRELEAEYGLFLRLVCGCADECCGADVHAAEAAARKREQEEFEEAASRFANALARATLGLDQ